MPINFKFKDWLFSKLPSYFKENDTYKDYQDKGLLERYLSIFGLELDNELIDYVHNFTDILDINTTPDKFLPFIGWTLGSPPDLDGNPVTYRKWLSYIVSIYKIKGTICSYNLLFNFFGLNVLIYEHPKKALVKYDSGYKYDEDNKYDGSCNPCTEYSLFYYSQLDNCSVGSVNPIPQATLDAILEVICFLQPIDAKLKDFGQAVNLCEDAPVGGDNELTIETLQLPLYDIGLTYDAGVTYDTPTSASSNTYYF